MSARTISSGNAGADGVIAVVKNGADDHRSRRDEATHSLPSEDTHSPAGPKFQNVWCSQCGRDFGPGDHGFSHCDNHMPTARTISAAPVPADSQSCESPDLNFARSLPATQSGCFGEVREGISTEKQARLRPIALSRTLAAAESLSFSLTDPLLTDCLRITGGKRVLSFDTLDGEIRLEISNSDWPFFCQAMGRVIG